MNDFSQLKKADLHCHLTGALTPINIRKMAKIMNIELDVYEPLENKMSFENIEIWEIVKKITADPKGFALSVESIIQNSIDNNVCKIELISNLRGLVEKGMNIEKMIYETEKVIRMYEKTGISCSIRIGVNRREKNEGIDWARKIFHEYKLTIFCGIDINGDERNFPIEDIRRNIGKVIQSGIPTTIHAGEYLDLTESLETAIDLQPQRIGHGISIVNNLKMVDKLRENNIYLEVCPTSNIKTGAVSSIKEHPIFRLLKENVPLIIASDDPALFHSNLNQEYELLFKNGVNSEVLKGIAQKSLVI